MLRLPIPPNRIPLYFDTEFTELSPRGSLISIGIVNEAGDRTFYAELTGFPPVTNEWMLEHVVANLRHVDANGHMTKTATSQTSSDYRHFDVVGSPKTIQRVLLNWLSDGLVGYPTSTKYEFRADCGAYDWMHLVELLTDRRTALELPVMVDYISGELCTLLKYADIDPDANRLQLCDVLIRDIGQGIAIPTPDNGETRHNALTDAFLCRNLWKLALAKIDD